MSKVNLAAATIAIAGHVRTESAETHPKITLVPDLSLTLYPTLAKRLSYPPINLPARMDTLHAQHNVLSSHVCVSMRDE